VLILLFLAREVDTTSRREPRPRKSADLVLKALLVMSKVYQTITA
jgi:hypothetical protein